MRLLNTSLWDLGKIPKIDRDFEQWIPVMFPPPPPPPPPMPCVPKMPCLDADGNKTLIYTLITNMSQLCAPAPGSNVSHTVYSGVLCGGDGSKQIQWQSAYTRDPRDGVSPAQCTWTFTAGSKYTGYCGSCAALVRLPTEIC